MKGKFITFEGSEGSGKSTQSKFLYNYLKRMGYRVFRLREPGGTKISEKIREILLDYRNHSMNAECEMLLYMAARSQIVSEVIKPALNKGFIVISDRFLDSTIAYQGFGLGMDIKIIKQIGEFVTYGLRPDLTIFLDLPIRKGLNYRKLNKDRIERRSFAYHARVRRGYLKIAKTHPKRIKIVKVEKDKAATQERVRELAENVISKD